MNFDYYWNNIPNVGKCRNNLVYTSLIADDEKTFCQWFYNDHGYHGGQNEVVDMSLMTEKFNREVCYLNVMHRHFPELIPEYKIDTDKKKIYLTIDGYDFWNKAKCNVKNYNKVVPDWEYQMLEILQAHKKLGLYKFSLHPSSYFVIDGKLKSFNYFFTYHESEGPITISDHASHIYSTRQDIVKAKVKEMNVGWDTPESLNTLQHVCFESFQNNYTTNFINSAKEIYCD